MNQCVNCSKEFTDDGVFLTDDSHPFCNPCRLYFKDALTKVLKKLSDEDWTALSSGHDLYKPSFYIEKGFAESFVWHFVREHKSDGTWKGSITTPDGKILATVFGVNNLEFLIGLRDIFALKPTFLFGRGSYAREIIRHLEAEVQK